MKFILFQPILSRILSGFLVIQILFISSSTAKTIADGTEEIITKSVRLIIRNKNNLILDCWLINDYVSFGLIMY